MIMIETLAEFAVRGCTGHLGLDGAPVRDTRKDCLRDLLSGCIGHLGMDGVRVFLNSHIYIYIYMYAT